MRKVHSPDEYAPFVLPHATKRMRANGYWESIFRNDMTSMGKASAYLLDADTVRKHCWSAIRRECLFVARFRLSQHDLEQRGWCIVYSEE